MTGNGVVAIEPLTERQHCSKCKTDGEHAKLHNQLVDSNIELWRCATCGDVHEKHGVVRKGPTFKTAGQRQLEATSVAQLDTAVVPASDGEPVGGPVNHPPHYNVGKIEVIDAIEDWKLGFNDGNAIKYISRARYKGKELEDLKKARWYIERRIAELLEGAAQAAV